MIGQRKGKVGLEVVEWEESKERGRPVDRGKWRKRRWKEDKTEPCGLEKPQVARDLIAGDRAVWW